MIEIIIIITGEKFLTEARALTDHCPHDHAYASRMAYTQPSLGKRKTEDGKRTNAEALTKRVSTLTAAT